MEGGPLEIVSLPTCLSPNVKNLIMEAGISNSLLDLITGITIDWEKLGNHFISDPDVKNYLSEVPKDKNVYFLLVKHLGPCINSVNVVYNNLTGQQIDQLECSLTWTTFEKDFMSCYELLKSDQDIDTILGILIITAYTERSLGNLFLLKGKQVPFLIKDLINSKELKEIIGVIPVLALRIVMGSPLFLNLRNILWHGFAGHREIHKRYGYFLLAILASIKIRDTLHIKPRKQLLFNKFVHDFSANEEYYNYNYEVHENSPIVYEQMLPYWAESIKLCQCKRWGQSLILSLPALENCVRVLYGTLNNSPRSIFIAENETLYLTFDEMFAENSTSGVNKLRSFLGDNLLEMFLDLLMYEEGPRLRDRVSHGEVNLKDIPKELAQHVLYLGAVLCYKATESRKYEKKFMGLEIAEYEGKYHPSCQLRKQILEILTNLEAITDNNSIKIISFEMDSLKTELLNYNGLNREEKSTILKTLEEIRNLKTPPSIYSTHRELLLIKATRQITRNILEITINVKNALISKELLIKEGKLRSRQRTNYEKLVESVPLIKCGLQILTLVTNYVWLKVKKLAIVDGLTETKLLKFLKKLLQYAENLKVMTDSNNNEWIKTCDTINIAVKYIINYFSNALCAFKVINN